MSVSIQQNIPFITPVHNAFYTVCSSTNTTQPNFRYVFDVFTGTTATSQAMVSRRSLLPRPTANNCIFSPQGILRNYLSYDRSVYSTSADTYSTSPAYTQYLISYGEEYLFYWSYTDFFFASAYPAYSAYTGYIGLTGTTRHYYQAGDQITIDHATPNTNPQFDGNWTVIAAPDNFTLITSMVTAIASPPESGTTVYTDLHSTVLSGLTYYTGDTFNAAIQYLQQPSWNYLDYIMSGTSATKRFLTNQPRAGVKIKDSQYATLSYINTQSDLNRIRLAVTQQNGLTVNYSGGLINTSANISKIVHIPAGVENMNQRFGVGTIDFSRDSYYQIYLTNTGGTISESITYLLDDDCNKWDTFRFMFLNKLGGWDYMNATLKSYESNDITKTNFYKIKPYNFTTSDRGQTTRFVESKKRYTVWTDFVDTNTARWIVEELFESPEVYWLSGDTSTVIQVPIMLSSNGAEIFNTNNKRLNQYPIDFYLSNDQNTQSNS